MASPTRLRTRIPVASRRCRESGFWACCDGRRPQPRRCQSNLGVALAAVPRELRYVLASPLAADERPSGRSPMPVPVHARLVDQIPCRRSPPRNWRPSDRRATRPARTNFERLRSRPSELLPVPNSEGPVQSLHGRPASSDRCSLPHQRRARSRQALPAPGRIAPLDRLGEQLAAWIGSARTPRKSTRPAPQHKAFRP